MKEDPENIYREFGSIQVVKSLSDLFNTKIIAPINCLWLPREISGDFDGLARTLAEISGCTPDLIDQDRLQSLAHLIKDTRQFAALEIILNDMRNIQALEVGVAPLLILKAAYRRDNTNKLFHDDGRDKNTYTENTLCCYNKPPTECLRNSDAIPLLNSNFYEARVGAPVFSFSIGGMYRYTGRYKNMPPPFIHREGTDTNNETIEETLRLFLRVLKGVEAPSLK